MLREWVTNLDMELREREAANEEEGKEERSSVSSPGALDGLETSARKRLHVKQSIDHALNLLSLKSHFHSDAQVYALSRSHSASTQRVYQTHTNPSTQTDCDGVINYCITPTKFHPSSGAPPAPLSTTTVGYRQRRRHC